MNNIAQQEEALFAEWENSHSGAFYRDGVPSPQLYQQSAVKVIFALREANFQKDDGEVDSKNYDFRHELRNAPHRFWKQKVAPWCYGLVKGLERDEELWEGARTVHKSQSDCIQLLNKCGFVQLKKTPGASKIKAEEVMDAVTRGQGFIRRQFAIYQPDIIIACGIGFPTTFDLLRKHVFAEVRDFPQKAGFQRSCAIVQAGKAGGSPTVLIETMHPSHRLKREPVFFQLMSDYRRAVEFIRQSQRGTATTN